MPGSRRNAVLDEEAGVDGHGSALRRIRRIAFDKDAIEPIAQILDVSVQLAPFRLPGGAVYQFLVPGVAERPAALVTLWPSLRRVDAVAGPATVVFTAVATVDLMVHPANPKQRGGAGRCRSGGVAGGDGGGPT